MQTRGRPGTGTGDYHAGLKHRTASSPAPHLSETRRQANLEDVIVIVVIMGEFEFPADALHEEPFQAGTKLVVRIDAGIAQAYAEGTINIEIGPQGIGEIITAVSGDTDLALEIDRGGPAQKGHVLSAERDCVSSLTLADTAIPDRRPARVTALNSDCD